MNQIEHRLRLDVLRDSVQGVIRVSRNDTRSRRLIISLTEGSFPYPLYGITVANLKAKKPDGTILFNSCKVENTVITYEITAQTTASAGDLECELILYGEGGEVLATPKFRILVEETVVSDDSIESADEFTALTEAIQQAAGNISVVVSGGNSTMFSTVADLKEATTLKAGDVVETSGFYEAGDGGGAQYKIVSGGAADGLFTHTLPKGLTAQLMLGNETLNVLCVGAKGDGSFDNAEILEAICNREDCKTLYFPRGVYCFTPCIYQKMLTENTTSYRFGKIGLLVDKDNMTLRGDGENASILKVADGVTERYRCVVLWQNAKGFTMHDLGVDQNAEHCPMAPEPLGFLDGDPPYLADGSVSTGAPGEEIPEDDEGNPLYQHNRNNHKLNCIAMAGEVGDLTVRDCSFRHYGSQAIMGNRPIDGFLLENNRFCFTPACKYSDPAEMDFIRSAGPYYDNSTIYVAGQKGMIRGNRFTSEADDAVVDTYVLYDGEKADSSNDNVSQTVTGQVQLMAVTAVELHTTDCVVEGNEIYDYETGVIVSQDTAGKNRCVVTGNTMTRVSFGVALWPNVDSPAEDITVKDNKITLTMQRCNYDLKNNVNSAAALKITTKSTVQKLNFTGNTVLFDRDTLTQDAVSEGIGPCAGFLSWFGIELEDLRVAGNLFQDMPMYGVYLHNVGGTLNLKSGTVERNTFLSCGWCDTLNTALATSTYKNLISRRAAIEISPNTLGHVEIINNQISDYSPHGECGMAILVSNAGWVKDGKVVLTGNTFDSASGAGFATGSLAQADISQVIDGTSQFAQFNLCTEEPANCVVKKGQVFFAGDKGWKCTSGGSLGRPTDPMQGTLLSLKSTSGSYCTIITMSNVSHGLRVGDVVSVSGKTLTVLMVNGAKVYATDWKDGGQNVEVTEPLAVTVAIQNTGALEEIEFGGEAYTGANGVSISGSEISLMVAGENLGGVKNGGNVTVNADGTMNYAPGDAYVGAFPIPGMIPNNVQKISEYTVQGATSVSDGAFAHADGVLSAGDDSIDLPELAEWDKLTANAAGTAIVTRQSSEIRYLKDFTWSYSEALTNTEESCLGFGSTEALPLSTLPADDTGGVEGVLLCTHLDLSSVRTLSGKSSTVTGIACKNSGAMRVRVAKAHMLEAGCTEDELKTPAGFLKWATHTGAAIIYEVASPAEEHTTLTPLTATSGVVALSGGYKGGTMTATAEDDLTQRIDQLEQRVAALEAVGG